MYRYTRPMLAVLALALPLIAGAQDQPRQQGPAGQTVPTQPSPGEPLPMPDHPMMPFEAPPWMPGPGFGRSPFGPEPSMPAPLRIRRQVTPDAYLLRIAPGDGKTADIQVTPRGRVLEISRTSGSETTEERSFDEGRGYLRSFSYSSGSTSRRIPVPPDADVSAMTREESDGTILIRIPRRSAQRVPARP